MQKQNPEQPVPGQQEDGSFDLSDVDVSDLPGVRGRDTPTEGADEQIRVLEAELEQAVEARKRAMADFVNFRRRAEENEIRARLVGASAVIRSMLPVLDHVDFALVHQPGEMTIEQLIDGVNMIHVELLKALERHDVRLIRPEPGSQFDPNEHQAVMRVETDEQEPNTIVALMQIGYALDETILRPATVSVAVPAETAGRTAAD